ncbi:MAG: heavy metal translocating P-type ATPase metal-binding domain-containing protein, partial [Deltaproteobacteria bacterium]|nr:heavy metal translocating P-type ATPase metal-binding domain-containing protein [Deltaproteobacteria bacterium]
MNDTKPCIHCGTQIPHRRQDSSFCCSGCAFVYKMIHDQQLDRYYKLKDKKTSPLIGLLHKKNNLDWVEAHLAQTPGQIKAQVKGVQCAACVWLIQEMAKKIGSAQVSINTAYGTLTLSFDPEAFDVKAYLSVLQDLGYVVSAPSKQAYVQTSRGLLIRVGICAALSMNVMMFSASIYTGLNASNTSSVFQLVTHINLVIATLAMLIGGTYFLQRAYKGLKMGLLHFDLPISIGIVLAYAGSLYTHFFGNPEFSYFDTVTIFITLMLIGRLVQQRMIEKNKNQIMQSQEASVFNIRKREGEAIVEIPFEEIQQGDRLLIPLGSIFPVACIAEQSVEIDLSWINGESTPVLKFVGELIPSGATLLGPHAVEVIADVEYHGAELAELLTQAQQKEMLPLLWQNFAKYYVIGVLSFVTIGFAFWFWKAGLHQAISVAVSIAVVTCPCSLGLAIPLARTLAYRILMFEGVLIQRSHTLDDMQKVQHVAFDKTGTLTMSDLHWRNL